MFEVLTLAEQNTVRTIELCHSIKSNFLEVGKLLYENLVNAYWSQCGYDSWSNYLESLGIASRSKLARLADIAQCVATQVLTEDDVIEMGVTCAETLLPVIRRGNLTLDLLEIAKTGSTRELRRALGHKFNENNQDYSVRCPHCGFEISGCKWVRKDADIL
jgi:hypothetical protein